MSYPRSTGPLRTTGCMPASQPRAACCAAEVAKDVPRKNEEEKSRDDEARASLSTLLWSTLVVSVNFDIDTRTRRDAAVATEPASGG